MHLGKILQHLRYSKVFKFARVSLLRYRSGSKKAHIDGIMLDFLKWARSELMKIISMCAIFELCKRRETQISLICMDLQISQIIWPLNWPNQCLKMNFIPFQIIEKNQNSILKNFFMLFREDFKLNLPWSTLIGSGRWPISINLKYFLRFSIASKFWNQISSTLPALWKTTKKFVSVSNSTNRIYLSGR